MNEEYIVPVVGKAFVSNEKGNLTQVDYTDKTHEIFVKNNLIEDMEKELKEIKSTIKELAGVNGRPSIKMLIHSVLAIAATLFVSALIIKGLNSEFTLQQFEGILVVCGSVGLSVFLGEYAADIDLKKYKDGCLFRKDYLESEITNKNEKLKQLEISASNMSINQSINLTPIKVDHQAELSKIRRDLEIYHYLGTNLKRLIKLQEKGQLQSTLKDDYNDEEMKFIEEEVSKHQLMKTRGEN